MSRLTLFRWFGMKCANKKKNMDNKIWVDPPNGWVYGFPKLWDKQLNPDFMAWLIAEGYPKSEIDSYGKHFYVRQWGFYDDES